MGDRYIFEYVKQAHEQAQSSGSKFSLMLSTFLRLSEYQKKPKNKPQTKNHQTQKNQKNNAWRKHSV